MNSRTVSQALMSIQSAFGTGTSGILADSAKRVIPPAIKATKHSWKKFTGDRGKNPEWGYDIYEERPLCFKPSKILKGAVVDIYCKVRWSGDSTIPCRQDIKMRIWSDDHRINFRSILDSERVKEELDSRPITDQRRVISRLHFDRANLTQEQEDDKQYHPDFHLQIGGVSKDYELSWHPKRFNLPRIPYPPMELFLTCQLVAINFFPEEYERIRHESHWKGSLRKIQRNVLQSYYDECARAICRERDLFHTLQVQQSP